MAVWQVRITLPYTTGIPRDASVNTWTLVGAPPTADAATYDLWRDRFAEFFNQVVSGDSLAGFMSPIISRASNACKVDFFSVGDLFTGTMTPIAERTFTLAGSTTSHSMPLEVALCTSLQSGERISPSGVPVARRRGRVFIGPLSNYATTTTPGVIPAPNSLLVTRLSAATKTLVDAGNPAGEGVIGVWSRVEGSASEVTKGWVDNAWDTQRRREVDATSRTSWTAA